MFWLTLPGYKFIYGGAWFMNYPWLQWLCCLKRRL